ncbi:hypothetical protein FAUST_10726 [Fusarium austroamericanum]|uniref:Uncharacterized protein n=1 Tax=Fusarium austroamericanum TaxID=282268 RepID=A0AAN5Z0P6_FUSAU|nr:hypothetical protein FAUST_10726 [Fusarium austroamericanum]
MASSVLTPSLRPVSLNLSGAETQNLRRLVRRWRIALTAINETSRPPLIDMILPLSVRSLSILHGLLAISSHASERSDIDLNHHQIALTELHAEISAANTDSNMDSIDHILRLLSLSMLLGIFTINQCDGSWVQHNRGMLSLVRSADQSALAQVPLGRFLMGICALQDISALSLGRRRQSQKAWLSWMAPRSKDRVLGDFTALEVTVGHSEQFLDILAQISEAADDNAHIYLQQSLFSSGNNTQGMI